jgi:hypothetical protein
VALREQEVVKGRWPLKDFFVCPGASHDDVWRSSSTLSLTSALDGGEWSTSRPGRFIAGRELRDTLSVRLGGFQSRSGCFGLSKNLFLMQEVESLALTKTVNRTEFLLFINATRFDHPLGVSSG